jgi:hypothetical protein
VAQFGQPLVWPRVDRRQRTLHFIETLHTADRFSGRLSVVVKTPKVNLRSYTGFPKLSSAKITVGGLDDQEA